MRDFACWSWRASGPHGEEPGSAEARRDTRSRAIEAYRALIRDFKDRDRGRVVSYEMEIATLEAQQQWEAATSR